MIGLALPLLLAQVAKTSMEATGAPISFLADIAVSARSIDSTMSGVQSMALGPHGMLVFADRSSRNLVWLDSSGRVKARRLNALGSRANGAASVITIGWVGDTVWAMDAVNGRVEYFDSSGAPATDSLLTPAGLAGFDGPFAPLKVLSGGRALSFPLVTYDDYRSGRAYLELPVVGLDARVVRTLAWVKQNRLIAIRATLSSGQQTVLPMGVLARLANRTGVWTATDDGSVVLVVFDVANAQFRISKIGWAGDTVYSRLFDYPPESIPSPTVDSLVRLEAGRLRGIEPGEAAALMREGLGATPTYAPVERVVPGRDGSVWLCLESRRAESVWLVIDVNGRPMFRALTPRLFTLLAATRDHAWGVTNVLDSLVIQRLVASRQRSVK